jgi:cytochrome c2
MNFRYLLAFFAITSLFLFSACSGEVNGVPEPRTSFNQSVSTGRSLITSFGCGSCHTIPGISGADSKAGPPLDHFYQRSYIAGVLPNTEENLITWIEDPQQVIPGNAMPNLGVTKDQARDIAAYLYHQPTVIENFMH